MNFLKKLVVMVAFVGFGAGVHAVTPAELAEIKELVNQHKYRCAQSCLFPTFGGIVEFVLDPCEPVKKDVATIEAVRILGRINAAYTRMCVARHLCEMVYCNTLSNEDVQNYAANCALVDAWDPTAVADAISEEEFAALEASMDAAAARRA